VQHETRDGVGEAVLPRADLDGLLERLEDAEETVAGLRVLPRGEEEAFPADLPQAMRAPGASRVALMRRHRRLSQQAPADAAGTSRAYVSRIETGHRGAGAELRRAIARALSVDADLLWPPLDQDGSRVA